jgi:hypothetical protein
MACKTRIDNLNGTSRHSAVLPHTGSQLARTPSSLSPLSKSTTTHANNRTQHDKHLAAARRTTIQLLPATSRPNKPDTPRHTRLARATLTSELPGCPASTGCCRRVGRSSTSACRTHQQPSHHTIAPSYPTLLAHPNRPLHYPIATHQNSTNHSNNTNTSHENKRRVNE